MTWLDLFLIGVGLSMDAFAVSVCKGLSMRAARARAALLCGGYFGFFQALMPCLGYFLGSRLSGILTRLGSWAAFAALGLIGLNMVRESFHGAQAMDDDLSPAAMLPLAVATSIDALAVGVSFAAVGVALAPAAALIGATTCALSAAGVAIGAAFGARWRAPAERLGGVVLAGIGLKILLQGLGLL